MSLVAVVGSYVVVLVLVCNVWAACMVARRRDADACRQHLYTRLVAEMRGLTSILGTFTLYKETHDQVIERGLVVIAERVEHLDCMLTDRFHAISTLTLVYRYGVRVQTVVLRGTASTCTRIVSAVSGTRGGRVAGYLGTMYLLHRACRTCSKQDVNTLQPNVLGSWLRRSSTPRIGTNQKTKEKWLKANYAVVGEK